MGSRLYNKFAALIKRWPVEATSSEKQLGDFVKKTFKAAYPHGHLVSTTCDEQKLAQLYESCNRLASNVHKNKHERLYPYSTASDIDQKQFENVIIDLHDMDTQNPTNHDGRGFMAKLKNTFKQNKQ